MSTIEESPGAEPTKQLRRSRSNRWIAGVCGGLAEYFGLSAAVYRVLFVALAFAGGTGILLYVAAAVVMPAQGSDEAPLAEALRRLAEDPALRARMGEAGRARALEHYTEAKVLARTLDLLGL